MYYLDNKVRLGESSGSAHTMVSIPVVLEMNGAERVEDLRVIKVPYGDVHAIASIDFAAGAQVIAACIRDESYKTMLRHNLQQAGVWDNGRIGKEYLKLFGDVTISLKGYREFHSSTNQLTG